MPAFLIKPVAKLGIVLILIVAAVSYRAVLLHERNTARAEAAQFKAERDAAIATNTAMAAMVDKSNAAVAAMSAKADEEAKRADLFAAEGVKAKASAARAVNAIAQKQIGSSCREAMDDEKRSARHE